MSESVFFQKKNSTMFLTIPSYETISNAAIVVDPVDP